MCSDDGLLTLGEDFVAGKSIASLVVGAHACGVGNGNEGRVIVVLDVVVQVTDILRSEVRDKTVLSVLDFKSHEGIVVIFDRVVNELIVQSSLKHHLEIGHNTGMVAVLVLGEQGKESQVALLDLGVLHSFGGETKKELNEGAAGHTPEEADNTMLENTKETSKLSKSMFCQSA